MSEFGKIILFLGLGLTLLGVVILLLGKFTPMERLPGDIVIKKEGFTFHFPLTTCIILSLTLSFILFLFSKK